MNKTITLTENEAKVLLALIDELSGGNPENVFSTDKIEYPPNRTERVCTKIYMAAGRPDLVPQQIRIWMAKGLIK